MSKKIVKVTKIELVGGETKPGPKLASANINMGKFCIEFNNKTSDKKGEIIPVIITAFDDKSYLFEIKTSPVTKLLLKYAFTDDSKNVLKGASKHGDIVGNIKKDDIRKIAEYKMPDLNCINVESAIKMIEASAKSMGLKII